MIDRPPRARDLPAGAPTASRRRRCSAAAGLLAVATLSTGLVGCTSGDGSGAAALADLDVAKVLNAQVVATGVLADPGTLKCDDAKITVGASIACSFTTDGVPVGLTAKVTSLAGTKLGLDISTTAKAVPAAVLGESVAVQAGKQLGAAIDGATCAGDLQPEVGETASCTLTSGSETKDVTATVTAVDGGQTAYSVAAS